VTGSRSHRRIDEHGNEKNLKSIIKHYHSPGKSTRRFHASLGLESTLSVSHVLRQRRGAEGDILQGEIRKIKTKKFNGEHRKG
jgi:hypothetical protein